MKYTVSRCFALQTPRASEAFAFYREVIGLEVNSQNDDMPELALGENRLFFDTCPEPLGPIFELVVDDIEAARDELIGKGCTVLRWEGVGKTCYIRDPFGFVFNLWQEPAGKNGG